MQGTAFRRANGEITTPFSNRAEVENYKQELSQLIEDLEKKHSGTKTAINEEASLTETIQNDTTLIADLKIH